MIHLKMKVTLFGALLTFALSALLELGAATTSYLYVVSAADRVRRFAVSDTGAITLDKADFITCNSGNDVMTRPVKIVRIGRVFYVLDQYADSALGYFSIAQYDLTGNFLGKLVHRGANVIDSKLGKADGMAASPDGKWLYINDFDLGAIFKVSVETGALSTFATGMSQNRDIHVTSDGKIYATSRANKKIYVFNPDGTAASPAYYSFANQVGGVYVDEAAGKVYGRYSGSMQIHNLGTDSVIQTVSMPGQGLCIEKVGDKLVSGNWTIWNPQSILFTCDPSNSYAISDPIASGLGNIQDVYLDPNGLDTWPVPPQAHTSFIAQGDDLFFAADNAKPAVGAEALSTIWKSTDGGAHWSQLTTLNAANPTFADVKGNLMLLSEPRRSASEAQYVAAADLAADGTLTPVFAATNTTGNVFIPANGRMVTAHWGFAGLRLGIGLKTATANTMAGFTFVADRAASYFPDAGFSPNVTTNKWDGNSNFTRRSWSDTLPVLAFKDAAGEHRELGAAVQTRSTVATRVGPEYAVATEHLNGSSFSPKWAPVVTDRVMLPGASKAFDIVYDATSALYWAVTIPATNTSDLVTIDPGDIRNVVAVYASPDLATWRLCKVVRAEGTPKTVAFANPQLAIVGNDLVIAYSSAGADNTGKVTIDPAGMFVCARVANFRVTWPGALDEQVGLAMPEFTACTVKLCRHDPLTDTWTHTAFITNGVYGGARMAYMGGIAVAGTRIYLSTEAQGIWAFDLKGRFRRFYPVPSGMKCDTICAEANGQTLLVTDCSYINNTATHNSVRRLNTVTGEWTTLVSGTTDATFKNPRGICAKKDGSFFVASRDGSFVRLYTADGSSYTTIRQPAGALSLALDADESHLFVGTHLGWIQKIDLSDNSALTLTAPVANPQGAAHAISLRDGRLWVSDWGAGYVYSLDPDTPYQTPRMECSGFEYGGRNAFVDLSLRDGMWLIIR